MKSTIVDARCVRRHGLSRWKSAVCSAKNNENEKSPTLLLQILVSMTRSRKVSMKDYVTVVPKELDVDGWWKRADCKGMRADKVKPEACVSCDVYRECIWFALTEDDRIEYGIFIRGGLTGAARDTIWYKHKTKPLLSYIEACRKALLVREKIVRERKVGKSK